jgi:hypothetical protein
MKWFSMLMPALYCCTAESYRSAAVLFRWYTISPFNTRNLASMKVFFTPYRSILPAAEMARSSSDACSKACNVSGKLK